MNSVAGYLPSTAILFKKSYGDNFRQASVVDVKKDDKKVVLDNGETLDYTDLVIAVGSDGPFPSRALDLKTIEGLKEGSQGLADEVKMINEAQ